MGFTLISPELHDRLVAVTNTDPYSPESPLLQQGTVRYNGLGTLQHDMIDLKIEICACHVVVSRATQVPWVINPVYHTDQVYSSVKNKAG